MPRDTAKAAAVADVMIVVGTFRSTNEIFFRWPQEYRVAIR
jgi:hypothetical protein